ncbi:MAG: TetR family transcriptional regulator [Candidatus Hydrogenedens sp.]|nr:TetR family transcriptional regulator [Candidatus Hydrogenedens sp.]
MARPSCREHLLDAAEAVVVAEGGARLTLDAVAEHAGVSKGGLLYHFPTKEALLQAMIERHLNGVRERRAKAAEGLTPGPGSDLVSEVRAAMMRSDTDRHLGSALLAVAANDPKLLAPAVEFHKERFGRLSQGTCNEGCARRALVLLAADGLIFLDLLNLAPFDEGERTRLFEALLRMAEEIAGETESGPTGRRDP